MKNTFEKQYDVAVAGAGIAGISAALAAARQGCKVCIIDKQTLIGGLATAGFIFVYLPLCDGEGHQVTFGIAEELLRAGMAYGPYKLSKRWGGDGEAMSESALSEGAEHKDASEPRDRFAVQFTPAEMILALDKILKESGADLWLDTRLCDVRMNGDSAEAIEVENSSGAGVIRAKRFIDASGDACLVRLAGGEYVKGSNSNNPWIISYDPTLSGAYSMGKPVMMTALSGRSEERGADLSGKELTQFTREAWQLARDYYDKRIRDGKLTRGEIYPLVLPSMPQLRTTAHIKGAENIMADEYNMFKKNSVGLVGDWRCSGKIWETPYGALIPEKVNGVLAAGRCIASGGDSWHAYRVIPACALTGEAAGTAAALSIRRNEEPRELPLDILRAKLKENGFRFHISEILK